MPIQILPPVPAASYFTTTTTTTTNPDSDLSDDGEAFDDSDSDVDMDTLISRASARQSTRPTKPRPKRTGHFHRPNPNHLDADALSTTIVTPGELVTSDPQWMRGHGTYLSTPHPSAGQPPQSSTNDDHEAASTSTAAAPQLHGSIISTLCGTLHKTNKLLSILPLSSRYTPAIGDLVVARISSVHPSRWRCDIASQTTAVLLLSSINLPGGILRRRTASDELQMRNFFSEGDLLVAEVQGLFSEGGASLHTRSLRYGKLRGGYFLSVGGTGTGSGVARSKSHVWTIVTGRGGGEVDVIAGVNGYMWIGRKNTTTTSSAVKTAATTAGEVDEEESREMYSSVSPHIAPETRREISRIAGCVRAMVAGNVRIDEAGLNAVYEAALDVELEEEEEGGGMDVDVKGGAAGGGDGGKVWLEGERGRRVVQRGMAILNSRK
ncbi:putative exosome complex exonuclease Rrp4 [Peziza echinospora]|nr:putative exosome complex exonuclease Rrp4 [Peziza echinospora]